MYKQVSALYLEAAQFRAGLEKHLKSDGAWAYGTLAFVVHHLEEAQGKIRTGEYWMILCVQHLTEVGCAYVRDQRDVMNAVELIRAAREAVAAVSDSIKANRPPEPYLQLLEASLRRLADDVTAMSRWLENTGAP